MSIIREDQGILRITNDLEDLPSPVKKRRPSLAEVALEGCRVKHPDQIEGLLKYLAMENSNVPTLMELKSELGHRGEGASWKHNYLLIAPSHCRADLASQ